MKLIADSGSTKTSWALVVGSQVLSYITVGLNPHFTSDERFEEVLAKVRQHYDEVHGISMLDVEACYFYGAGCGSVEAQDRVHELLHNALAISRVEVQGDLMGACRALCGTLPGLVGILGTGSNACYYDGKEIRNQVFSTGYVLGDEGSGNHIGRRLLKDYLTQKMPQSLQQAFQEAHPESAQALLAKLYHEPNPNRFLASLAPFALHHREEAYIQQLLYGCFTDFLTEMVLPLQKEAPKMPLHLVGSIAYHFKEELTLAAQEQGVQIGQVLQEPLAGLVK